MRKLVALTVVALLSLTMALAVIGCGGQRQESAQPETPAGESMMGDTAMMADTAMQH